MVTVMRFGTSIRMLIQFDLMRLIRYHDRTRGGEEFRVDLNSRARARARPRADVQNCVTVVFVVHMQHTSYTLSRW